jgi:hypothetical protein
MKAEYKQKIAGIFAAIVVGERGSWFRRGIAERGSVYFGRSVRE